MLSSFFPTAWKIAEVVPIPKTDDYELATNNRPISLLPVLSKVCERVVHKQVDSYLIFKDRLASTQSGNKRHHSTETSIIHSNDFILNAMDNKKLTASVFLDMSKAFDSLNHDLLIKKLRHIGLSSQVILWFQSIFHSDIREYVSIQACLTFYPSRLEYQKDPSWDLCFSVFTLMIFLYH